MIFALRSACSETEDGLTGAEIPIYMRLEWINQCRNGAFDHVTVKDMDKYLFRGLEKMPWIEMSQADFLIHVVNARVVPDEVVFPNAVQIMEIVVNNPDRLLNSAFKVEAVINRKTEPKKASSIFGKKSNALEVASRG